MNTKEAGAKLRNVLGSNAEIRDRKHPTSQVQRDADKGRRADTKIKKEWCAEAMKARREAILGVDAEYQQLKKEYIVAAKAFDDLPSIPSYRYKVGKNNGLFFTVEAEADTVEELVEKIEAKYRNRSLA